MKFRDTSCCAWQEISNLSQHPTPEDAMKSFCELNFGAAESRVKYHTMQSLQNHLYSFYLFSTAVNTPGTEKESSYLPKFGTDYGSKFAKFIQENKLGTVVESPMMVNAAFHADHSNVVWIWAPDEAAIQKWWADSQETFRRRAEEAKQVAKEMLEKAAQMKVAKAPAPQMPMARGAYQGVIMNMPIPVPEPAYILPDWDEYNNLEKDF